MKSPRFILNALERKQFLANFRFPISYFQFWYFSIVGVCEWLAVNDRDIYLSKYMYTFPPQKKKNKKKKQLKIFIQKLQE